MKKVLKIIAGISIVYLIIVVLVSAFSSKTNDAENNESKNEISNDSIYKKATIFLNEKNYKYAQQYGLELLNKDTSSVKSKELMNTIENGIINEIEVLEASAPNMSKFRKSYDEFNQVTWYYSESTPSLGNDISIYFGKNDNGELYNLRFVIKYYASNWIFWKKAKFLVDGESFEYIPTEVKRDNDNGLVWEYSDDSFETGIKGLMMKISNSKESKYRLSGKYNYDNTISAKQKTALKDVLALFEAYEKVTELQTVLNQ